MVAFGFAGFLWSAMGGVPVRFFPLFMMSYPVCTVWTACPACWSAEQASSLGPGSAGHCGQRASASNPGRPLALLDATALPFASSGHGGCCSLSLSWVPVALVCIFLLSTRLACQNLGFLWGGACLFPDLPSPRCLWEPGLAACVPTPSVCGWHAALPELCAGIVLTLQRGCPCWPSRHVCAVCLVEEAAPSLSQKELLWAVSRKICGLP